MLGIVRIGVLRLYSLERIDVWGFNFPSFLLDIYLYLHFVLQLPFIILNEKVQIDFCCLFCKNFFFVKVLNFQPLVSEPGSDWLFPIFV